MPLPTHAQQQAYLKKIGFLGNITLTFETLKKMVEGHIFTFPFETINVHDSTLDKDRTNNIKLDFDAIFKRSVEENRGGHCVVLNWLLQNMLQSFGFEVKPILCDAMWGSDAPKGKRSKHCATIVTVDGKAYLVDAGFGSVGLLSPVLLQTGEYKQYSEKFRLVKSKEYAFECQVWDSDSWESLYGIDTTPASLEDYQRVNRIESSPLHPECIFSNTMLCTKPYKIGASQNGRIRILNDYLTVSDSEKVTKRSTFTTAGTLAKHLKHYFGIELPGDEIRFTKEAQEHYVNQGTITKAIVPLFQQRRVRKTAVQIKDPQTRRASPRLKTNTTRR